jgi:excisionase family DNA binding protein
MDDEVLTVEAAADWLGYGAEKTRRLIRTGEVRGEKVGRSWRVSRQELERYLERLMRQQKLEAGGIW